MSPACRSRCVSQAQKACASVQLTRAAGRAAVGAGCPSDRRNGARSRSCVSTQAMRTGLPPGTGTVTISMPRLFVQVMGAAWAANAAPVAARAARPQRDRCVTRNPDQTIVTVSFPDTAHARHSVHLYLGVLRSVFTT